MDHGQFSTRELVAGRYRTLQVVHREEGRTVWLGEDVGVGRPVSLLESRLAPLQPEVTTRRTVGRIMRDSEAMELLCPGQVAAVLDVVDDHGALWTVTERIEGTPLGEILDRGPLNYVRAARIGLGILDVLEAAHRQGMTHGDLSPGQVFVRKSGEVVVTGFGLIGTSVTQRVTAPSYASPEQARGSSAGPAADQWTLGALLYAMVEGRPPVNDRGPVEATLSAVDRLPLRSPVNAGPLVPAITGLLRRDALERVPESVVRAALTRIVKEELDEPTQEALMPCFQGWLVAHRAGRAWSRPAVRRSVLVGAGLAVAASAVAVLVAALRPDGGGASATGSEPSRSGAPSTSTSTSGNGVGGPPSPPATSRTAAPSPSASSRAPQEPTVLFQRYVAPEGFSVDLPQGWTRVRTEKAAEGTYRVTFGASGDPRSLTVTYSVHLGTDPVAVWQALEPSLRQTYTGYQRVGDIRAVTYQGYPGADMVWLSTVDGVRVRTFGRGFLVGDDRGCSLRWTTPAADAQSTANKQALDVFLGTFRPPSN
ncbi:serine/threonine-protein kinase [Streptomyces hygroscopicus]|uniref:serine/threonine protein kinase n=1 Tax=Streptomyces hygroscopicus TaxID=1912 RepID=UPI002AD463D6|nr:serine/threonine-protein kinase [Streptomyces hygroscopicus]